MTHEFLPKQCTDLLEELDFVDCCGYYATANCKYTIEQCNDGVTFCNNDDGKEIQYKDKSFNPDEARPDAITFDDFLNCLFVIGAISAPIYFERLTA